MTVTVGFLNLQGARREQKWKELFNQLESEGMAIFGVAEMHLRDLEEPPCGKSWNVVNERSGGRLWAVTEWWPPKQSREILGGRRFEAREATSKITYDSRLRLMDRGRWAKRLFIYTYLTGVQTGWRKRLYQLEKKYGFFSTPVTITSDRKWEIEIRNRVREEEAARWAETAKSKSTLYMYHRYKHEISAETRLYDNSLGSRLLIESRAGGLRTQVYRRRFDQTVESVACRVCGQADETIEHLVLSCTGLQPVQPA
ncbi:hypothetical protein HPB47_019497 [Ixodes persulcatus]|uniref:Uncharacterized protein n=1 Tax=Ixodes persulcatus TaxID=34615 RepID=A0AC60QLM1_IXOPE|nr:hypothetical protein HPB47_019497 [Ixodes persulcatus]